MTMTRYPYDKTYTLCLSIGYYGADREVEYSPSEELEEEAWERMDDSEREDYLYQTAVELLEEYIEISFT